MNGAVKIRVYDISKESRFTLILVQVNVALRNNIALLELSFQTK